VATSVCRLTHAVAFDAAVVQQGSHPVNKQFYSVFFYLKSTSNTICSTFCHFEHISNWNWTFNKFKFSAWVDYSSGIDCIGILLTFPFVSMARSHMPWWPLYY